MSFRICLMNFQKPLISEKINKILELKYFAAYTGQ